MIKSNQKCNNLLFLPFRGIQEMFPASGGARVGFRTTKAIRFAKHGCTNRPFYHIVVMEVCMMLHFFKLIVK